MRVAWHMCIFRFLGVRILLFGLLLALLRCKRFNVPEGLVLSAHPLLTLRGDPMGEPQGRVYRGTFCTGHVPMVGTTSIQVSLVDTIGRAARSICSSHLRQHTCTP